MLITSSAQNNSARYLFRFSVSSFGIEKQRSTRIASSMFTEIHWLKKMATVFLQFLACLILKTQVPFPSSLRSQNLASRDGHTLGKIRLAKKKQVRGTQSVISGS